MGLLYREQVMTLGLEVDPMGQIWACVVIEGTGDYLGTRGWSHETNMGL
jgi:hypothetical protein